MTLLVTVDPLGGPLTDDDLIRLIAENRDNPVGAAMLDAARQALGRIVGIEPFFCDWLQETDRAARLPRAEVWDAYQRYCDDADIPEDARWSRRRLYAAVQVRFESYRTARERGFRGVRLA